MRIKRTKITVVNEHVFTYAEHRLSTQVECPTCGGTASMIRFEDVPGLSGLSPEVIRKEVEASGRHFAAGPDGSFLLCLNSTVD